MALSSAASKLLAYLGIYKLTGTQYFNNLKKFPKAIGSEHGTFVSALNELYTGGY